MWLRVERLHLIVQLYVRFVVKEMFHVIRLYCSCAKPQHLTYENIHRYKWISNIRFALYLQKGLKISAFPQNFDFSWINSYNCYNQKKHNLLNNPNSFLFSFTFKKNQTFFFNQQIFISPFLLFKWQFRYNMTQYFPLFTSYFDVHGIGH